MPPPTETVEGSNGLAADFGCYRDDPSTRFSEKIFDLGSGHRYRNIENACDSQNRLINRDRRCRYRASLVEPSLKG
jgi:hypothetical protein